MTEKTKRIIQTIAAKEGKTPEYVEEEMMKAIRAAMATTDPHAQALWRQIAPDGKEPDLDTFLEFAANRVGMMTDQPKSKKNGNRWTS